MRARGFSLVELMVALTLSIFILAALLQSYAASAALRRSQDAAARVVETGRTASELIARSARMAGYWGCTSDDTTKTTLHDDLSSADDSVGGNAATRGLSTKGLFGVNGATTTPDELIAWRAEDDRATTLASSANLGSATTLTVVSAAAAAVTSSDWISVSNCAEVDVFKLSGVASNTLSFTRGTSGTCTSCTRTYASGATVQRVLRQRFYIATGAAGRPSLFVQENGGTGRELLPGVENMQVTYGVDTDADGVANQYLTAPSVSARCGTAGNDACWRQVSSVRIALLVASEEDSVSPVNQNYYYNGATLTATDRRIRREFLTVVSVRNYRG